MKRVLVPFAEGFEELEAVTIIDILRRAHIEVVVASLAESPVTGSHGIRLAADTPLAALAEQDFDMIALPGGMPGADHLKKDPRIAELVRRLHDRGGPLPRSAPRRWSSQPRASSTDGARQLSRLPEGRRRCNGRRRRRRRGPRRHHLAWARHRDRLRAATGRNAHGCRRARGRRARLEREKPAVP